MKLSTKDTFHVWRSKNNEDLEVVVNPDWYQDNGTPTDDYGMDMVFVKIAYLNKILEIDKVLDVWEDNRGDIVKYNPDWYQDNGTPSNEEGFDYHYLYSEYDI